MGHLTDDEIANYQHDGYVIPAFRLSQPRVA